MKAKRQRDAIPSHWRSKCHFMKLSSVDKKQERDTYNYSADFKIVTYHNFLCYRLQMIKLFTE